MKKMTKMGNYLLLSVLTLFVIGSQADTFRPAGVRQPSGHVILRQGGCVWSNTNKNATGPSTAPFFQQQRARANSLSIDCHHAQSQDFFSNYTCPDVRFGNYLSVNQILMQYKNQFQALEFVRCGIWKFPNLCEMNIVKLNLSNNAVTDLEELGLGECAQKSLQILDLSFNSLRRITNRIFSKLPEVRQLQLQANSLGELEDNALEGLVSLRFLNLSANRLVALPINVFKDTTNLNVLDLSNNEFTHTPANVFQNLKNLHTLILSKNRITFVDVQFTDLIGLQNLYLDHNRIQTLDEEVFKNCSQSLRDLDLAGNLLTTVPTALKTLKSLTTLDIGENKIQTITNDSFAGMNSLYGLRLVKNEITNLPEGLCDPINRLRVLNIAENMISKLSPHAISSCKELRILRLDSNNLDEMPPHLPSNLLWLNVSSNHIKTVSKIPNSLEWFDISNNELEYLAGVNSPSLRVLDASFNKLKELDRVPPQLETLRVNQNNLTTLSPEIFARAGRLRKLEIAGNPFKCSSSMEWLLKSNQSIPSHQYPAVADLKAVTCTPTFTGYNQLSPLPVPVMRLEQNDFLDRYDTKCDSSCACCSFTYCDCKKKCPTNCECGADSRGTVNIIKCSNSNMTEVPHIPMDATHLYLDSNNIPIINSLIFLGRRKMRTLFLNNSQIQTLKNNSFKSLTSLETLHLEDNLLGTTDLSGREFEDLGSLRELYLHDNVIRHLPKEIFAHLPLLEKLTLHNNQLSLYDFTIWEVLKSNVYLNSLTISNNPFNCECEYLIGLKAWVAAKQTLVVDFSIATCYPKDDSIDQRYMQQQVQPQLIANMCDHNKELKLNYNQNNDNFPALLDSELLNNNHISAEKVASNDMNNNALIPNQPTTEVSSEEKGTSRKENGGEMWTIFTSVLITVIIVLLAIVFLLFRKDILPFLLYTWSSTLLRCCCGESMRCKSNRGAGEMEDEKLFDAYFIYSKSDEYLVTQKIVPHLQSAHPHPTHPQYRICLHRDLCIGHSDGLSNTEIEMALTCSDSTKRIIIVLSRQFFQHELSHPGFRSAFQTIISRYQSKVVFILLPPFNEQNLLTIYPELKADHLSKSGSSNITSLEYNGEMDKSFVDKLKLLLPSPTLMKASANSTSTISSTGSSAIFNMVPSYHPHENLINCNTINLHDYAYNTINHQYHRNIIPFNGTTPPVPKHHIALTTPAWQNQNPNFQNFYNNSQNGQIIPIPGYPTTTLANIPSFNESFRRHLQMQQNQSKMLITGDHLSHCSNSNNSHGHPGHHHHHHSHHHQGSHCSSHSSSTSNNQSQPYQPLSSSSEHVYSTLDSPPIITGSENSCETAISELNCIDEQDNKANFESHPLRVSPSHQNRLNHNKNTSCPVDNNNSGTQQSSNLTNNGTNNSTNNNGTMYFV